MKTIYAEHKHDREKYLDVTFGKVKTTDKFKYHGVWLHSNGLENEPNKVRVRKIEQNRYNERVIAYNTNVRHYVRVVKPERLIV